MLKLNIAQQYAKLALAITEPAVNLDVKPPQIQLATEPAIVEIRQEQGRLSIDGEAFRQSLGYRTSGALSKELAREGKQRADETIAKYVAEGNRLGRIESGENAVANMAAEALLEEAPQVVLKTMAAPEFHYQPAQVECSARRGQVNLAVERGAVEGDLQRGQVAGRLAQYPNVRFWTTEGKYDISV